MFGMALSTLSSFCSAAPFRAVPCVSAHHHLKPHLHITLSTPQEGGAHTAAVEDTNDFIEIGVIRSTHGIHGELKIAPSTDFPEERLEKPGIRWLRIHQQGRTMIHQVELTKGRHMGGKEPSWLVTFRGINDREKASEFVGTTLLISASDKPMLTDDEFYIPDLVGMQVVLQKSGEVVGEIMDVFRTGASDLLHVKMVSSSRTTETAQKQKKSESFAWIPFVTDIVPTVDKNRRVVEINPPEGLLELYTSEGVSRKEFDKQKLREKRKLREKVGGIKKRLAALKQEHLLSVLASDNKIQKDTLLQQLVTIDFKLFQHALESASMAATRFFAEELSFPSLLAIPHVNREGLEESDKPVDACSLHWWRIGLQLIGENRVAVAVLPITDLTDNLVYNYMKNLKNQAEHLLYIQTLAQSLCSVKSCQILWIVITTDASEEVVKGLFESNFFFGLNEMQVIFVKRSSLPYVDFQHNILMESSGKILTGFSGEGHVFYDLTVSGTVKQLIDQGIHYLQIYTLDYSLAKVADPIFFGFTHEKQASIGMKIIRSPHHERETQILCLRDHVSDLVIKNAKHSGSRHYAVVKYENLPSEILCDPQESSNLLSTDTSQNLQLQNCFYRVCQLSDNIYSVKYLHYLASHVYRLQYEATLESIPCIQKVENCLTQSGPDEYHAIQLKCSIHSALAFCNVEEVALLEDI